MKKVLSSKGVFEISDSLYENIKKNNPELLMEDIWDHTGSDDSGMNMFIINSLVDDIFKNEKNKNKRSINAIKQKVESIYKNKERNSLNVLDAFDDAKDYLNKVKKEYDNFKSIENNDNQEEKNTSNETNVDKKMKDFGVEKTLSKNEHENVEIKLKEIFNKDPIEDEELYQRVKFFVSEFITNNTITVIEEKYRELTNKDGSLIRALDKNDAEKCLNEIHLKLNKIFNNNDKNINNECINKNNNIILEYDDEDEIKTPDVKENEKLLKAKMIILGIDDDLKNWGKFKEWQKQGFPLKFTMIHNDGTKENIDILEYINNKNNLLKWITNSFWNEINNTLTIPIEGKDEKTKQKNGNAIAKHIFEMIKKYLFDSPIPKSLVNMISEIRKKYRGLVWITTFSISNFGTKKVLGFMSDAIKEDYIELVNNKKLYALNINLIKMLKPISTGEFWKNVMIYHCYTEHSFDIINNSIRQVTNSRDSIWNVGFKQIQTALSARTYMYRIEYSSDAKEWSDNQEYFNDLLSNMNDKNKPLQTLTRKWKLNGETLKKYDEQVLKKLPKVYYIVVTEGLFKKGKFLSNVGKSINNLVSGSNASSNRTKFRKEIGL